MYYMMLAVKREYHQSLTIKPVIEQLFDETIDAVAEGCDDEAADRARRLADGIFANHRHNLDAYISEARQKMYSIREELER